MLPPAAGAMVEVSEASPCATEPIGKIVTKENASAGKAVILV
jgi:hypothetical protein